MKFEDTYDRLIAQYDYVDYPDFLMTIEEWLSSGNRDLVIQTREAIRRLIDENPKVIDISKTDYEEGNIFHYCARGNLECLAQFSIEIGLKGIEEISCDGLTPLQLSIASLGYGCAKVLINNGASLLDESLFKMLNGNLNFNSLEPLYERRQWKIRETAEVAILMASKLKDQVKQLSNKQGE